MLVLDGGWDKAIMYRANDPVIPGKSVTIEVEYDLPFKRISPTRVAGRVARL